jgi:hypothetical protein
VRLLRCGGVVPCHRPQALASRQRRAAVQDARAARGSPKPPEAAAPSRRCLLSVPPAFVSSGEWHGLRSSANGAWSLGRAVFVPPEPVRCDGTGARSDFGTVHVDVSCKFMARGYSAAPTDAEGQVFRTTIATNAVALAATPSAASGRPRLGPWGPGRAGRRTRTTQRASRPGRPGGRRLRLLSPPESESFAIFKFPQAGTSTGSCHLAPALELRSSLDRTF